MWFLAKGVSDTVECQLKLCNRVVCNTCMISCWWSDRTTQADQVKLGHNVDSVSEASLENRRRLTSPLPAFGSQTHHIIDKWLPNAGNSHTRLRTQGQDTSHGAASCYNGDFRHCWVSVKRKQTPKVGVPTLGLAVYLICFLNAVTLMLASICPGTASVVQDSLSYLQIY